jgi:excisionase family DNA binding protein
MMIDEYNKRLIDVKAAAEYLSISRATLYRLVEENKIKSILLGNRRLFDIIELDQFIEELKHQRDNREGGKNHVESL